MDKIERDQFMKNIYYWSQEIKKNPVDLSTVVPGDCLISDRGLCFEVVRNNKKTLSIKRLVLSYKSCMRFYGKVDRFDKIDKDTGTYYKVTRQELVMFFRGSRLQREIEQERKPALITAAEDYIKTETAFLDQINKKYSPAKECECITHEGSHFIDHHLWWINHNADILKRGGQLAEHAFGKEEYNRLKDLEYHLNIEESKLNQN